MLANRYLVFGTVLIFISIKEGQSLRCFDCNSHINSDCADDIVPDKYNQNCLNESYVLCRKIKQVIDFQVNDLKPNTRIIRSCGMNQDEVNTCYQRSGFGGRQIVCSCNDGDGCNSSNTMSISTVLFVGALLLVKITVYN